MQFGHLELFLIRDGTFRLDGGAMFGQVPKVLWEKSHPADERNRILLGLNCLLVRTPDETILIDTIDAYTDSIDEHEIERSKNKLATQLILRSENPNGCMRSIGGQWLYRGEYLALDEQLARLTAVTTDDVRSLLSDMPLEPRTVVRLGPN